MKIGARVSVEGETLRQRPNISPIPFPNRSVITKVMRGKRFNSNLDKPSDCIFVQIRAPADNQPRNSCFQAGRTAMKIMKTRFRVGRRGGYLRDRQQCPSWIAKGHQVPNGRLAFGRQSMPDNASEGTDIVVSSVTFSLSAIANIENLTLTGSLLMMGTSNSLNNAITRQQREQCMDGMANIHAEWRSLVQMPRGGTGDDTFVVDDHRTPITENSGEGNSGFGAVGRELYAGNQTSRT